MLSLRTFMKDISAELEKNGWEKTEAPAYSKGIGQSGSCFFIRHSDLQFIYVTASIIGDTFTGVWRFCKNAKDYSGGSNNPIEYTGNKAELVKVVDQIQRFADNNAMHKTGAGMHRYSVQGRAIIARTKSDALKQFVAEAEKIASASVDKENNLKGDDMSKFEVKGRIIEASTRKEALEKYAVTAKTAVTYVSNGTSNLKYLIIKEVEKIEQGSIALAYCLNDDTFQLLWECGGDWTTFDDDARNDKDYWDGFTPGDLKSAVNAAEHLDLQEQAKVASDMDWYYELAQDAQKLFTE